MSWPCSSYTASSSMACPKDCTIPPWTWPSTSNGFRTFPQSSTATYFRSFTSPVSVSISTTQTWAPKGNVKFLGSKKVVEIDTETGDVKLLKYVAVDDCGN